MSTKNLYLDMRDVRPGTAPALMEMLAVAGAVAIGAQLRFPLPGTPVPVTLQTLPVLLAPFAVGRFRATGGMALYVLLGLLGTPLFAGSAGVGATFGYLLGFMAAPMLIMRFERPALGLLAGFAAVFGLGVTWLAFWADLSPGQALMMGFVPFIPGALLKGMAAYRIIPLVRR